MLSFIVSADKRDDLLEAFLAEEELPEGLEMVWWLGTSFFPVESSLVEIPAEGSLDSFNMVSYTYSKQHFAILRLSGDAAEQDMIDSLQPVSTENSKLYKKLTGGLELQETADGLLGYVGISLTVYPGEEVFNYTVKRKLPFHSFL